MMTTAIDPRLSLAAQQIAGLSLDIRSRIRQTQSSLDREDSSDPDLDTNIESIREALEHIEDLWLHDDGRVVVDEPGAEPGWSHYGRSAIVEVLVGPTLMLCLP